ncbi:MAG: RNA-binding domain-containing protein [Candidatus Hodarchaeaceae archaeon]|nr:RNA-binding domain-containing protein [Candidatus Hodarchaeaceae archaeon]
MLRLRVEAEVKPTEDPKKVEAAVKNIFPTLRLNLAGNLLMGESTQVEALDRLHQLLRLQAILDSARRVMRGGMRENIVRFMLNKQVAAVGRVSFTNGESPLGPIMVTLEAPDAEHLIDYLAPRTVNGKPIEEIKY